VIFSNAGLFILYVIFLRGKVCGSVAEEALWDEAKKVVDQHKNR